MATSANSSPFNGKMKSPKSVLEMVVCAIRQQPPTAKGVSRAAILKYMQQELQWTNGTSKKLNMTLQKAVKSKKLVQTGQSFRVAGDPVPEAPPEVTVDIEDIKEGTGRVAAVGDHVEMKYEGKLTADGTVFDAASSFVFEIGAGDVIKGWDMGIPGMKVGGQRKLYVPSKLGYGKRGSSPDIPPNADLSFVVTLKKIR